MAFTLTDKVLIDRAARLINEQAKALRNAYGQIGWSTSEEARKQKLVYDRLLRDERDLRALGRRLADHFGVKAAPRVAAVKPTPGVDLTVEAAMDHPVVTEPSLGEQATLGVNQGGGDVGF